MVSKTIIICLLLVLFCLCSPPSTKAVVTEKEDTATLLHFKSTILDPSNSLSSWLPSTPPCSSSWLGVSCHPSTRYVSKLVLDNLNLTGPIDSLFQLSHLRLLSLKFNTLYSSSSNYSFSSCPNLKLLYLSHNNFSGHFPSGLSHRLRRLDLSFNSFSGHIPITELSRLSGLLTLRLELNSFTGRVDSPLPTTSLTSLLDFNVSGNKLSGVIPAWLTRFQASSFSGNENLCGPPLIVRCSNPAEGVPPWQSEAPAGSGGGEKERVGDWLVILIVTIDAVALLAALVTVTCCCYYNKRKRVNIQNDKINRRAHLRRKSSGTHTRRSGGGYSTTTTTSVSEGDVMVVFEGCKGFADVDDLLKSSAELLGKGSVGTTYKVELEGGDVAVVKRVREQRRRRRAEVDRWLMVIGGLRQINVASLRAYYNSRDELLLVYDFLPCGSLHSLLHGTSCNYLRIYFFCFIALIEILFMSIQF